MTKRQTPTTRRHNRNQPKPVLRASFLNHALELRRRLFIIAASVIAWSAIAYYFENKIIYWLLKPAHGEKFIYTSPGGGIDFLIKVCVYAGIVMSAPVVIYQLLKFIQPLIGKGSARFIMIVSALTGLLALAGVLFGYLFGLPVALKFLLNQFQTGDITALITISSYLSFVIAYLAGASLIFQIPLWMFIANRIKPLKPNKLAKNQRWVILISFIIAALINPSPRPQDLFLLALPIILSYEVGVVVVWYANRYTKRPAHVAQLLQTDEQARLERLERAQRAVTAVEPEQPAPKPQVRPQTLAQRPVRSFSDFSPPTRRNY